MNAGFGVGPMELICIGVFGVGILAVLVLVVVLAMNRKTSGPVDRDMLACPDCGRMNSASDNFCSQCGKQFGSTQA